MSLALLATLPFLLAAVVVLVFDAGGDPPADYGCGESAGPGHDARVDAFRAGSLPWHAGGILVCLLTLAAISIARSPARGLSAIGGPTFAGIWAAITLLPLSLVMKDELGLLLGLLGAVIGAPLLWLAHPGGDLQECLFAVALLLGAALAAWLGVLDGLLRTVAAGIWWLTAFLVGHLFLVQLAGHGPILC